MSNEKRLNDLFNQAKELPSAVSFNEVSARFTASASSGAASPKRNLFSTKNVLIMLAITSIVVTALLLTTPSKEYRSEQPKSISTTKEHPNTPIELQPESNEVIVDSDHKTPLHSIAALVDEASIQVVETTSGKLEEEGYQLPFPYIKPKLTDDEYQFPKLTEDEIAANNKQKKAMLKALEKFDKKQYAYIPSGTFEYDGKMLSVQSFYMQRTEVTNLEYRTFLFDLLIQDRKEDFLKAKPDQTQWVAYFESKPYEEYYFSHKAYNDYPMVNVSKEGAEMYCKWLSEELNQFVDDKKKKNYHDVRLPQREEWIKAASNEGKQWPYPWTGQFVRNSEGLYQANFTPEATDSVQFTNASMDILAPVKSYWPNDCGLYNMSGNAAEMVYDSDFGTVEGNMRSKLDHSSLGTAGGSWRSNAEEIKLSATDPYKGKVSPMPMIGFRVVMTHLGAD